MAFCEFCGKQIEDGTVCECEDSRAHRLSAQAPPPPTPDAVPSDAPQQTPPQSAAAAQQAGHIAQSLKKLCMDGMHTVLTFFKSPSAAVSAACEAENFIQALFFLAVKALVIGIFVPLTLSSAVKSLLGYFGMGGMSAGDYFGTFLRVILFSVITDVVYFGVAFVAGKILFKSDVTAKGLLGATGAASLPVTVTFFISCLIINVSLQARLIVFGVLVCYCLATGVIALNVTLKLEQDKFLYTQSLVWVAIIVILFIGIQNAISGMLSGFPYLGLF
ncbi:MAG: hypothetical protein FWH49_02675 [Clostridiales bacterium]|nr:hypothetical protein [Clostridiales bacterium]